MMTEKYSNLILRLGMGFVFLWFGIDKFFNPEIWLGWIPSYAKPLILFKLTSFIYLLGVIETILGSLLALGLFTKFASFLCSIFLLIILISFGINEIMVRDIGLLAISISLFLSGAKDFSIDNYLKNKWRIKK